MNCPRCQAAIGPLTNPDGIVTCPACGARLMTRSAAIRSQGGARAAAAPPPKDAPTEAATAPELPPPSATLPPTPAMLLGTRTGPSVPTAQPATSAATPPPRSRAPAPGQDAFDILLRELREVRALEERILQRLEGAAPAASSSPVELAGDSALVSPIRARHQKTVVLIDDDPATRDAAVAELLQADVPVRAFADGQAALSAIAEEKPDVIVLELGLGGEMEGRDVINMIKSTMEWVDVPIVLWTREAIPSQKEARLLHGADELVAKSGGATALVARVIALFRRVH